MLVVVSLVLLNLHVKKIIREAVNNFNTNVSRGRQTHHNLQFADHIVDQDRKCNGRTALRDICKEWEENGEQQQKIEGVGEW